ELDIGDGTHETRLSALELRCREPIRSSDRSGWEGAGAPGGPPKGQSPARGAPDPAAPPSGSPIGRTALVSLAGQAIAGQGRRGSLPPAGQGCCGVTSPAS